MRARRAAAGCRTERSGWRRARQRGIRAVKIDVRKTKDGVLALFHDKTGERMLGLDVEFRELTLEQLRGRNLRFEGQESTNTVPTLREVFRQFGPALLFYLDMKNKRFEDADQIVALIEEFGLLERTILASVDPLFIAYVEHRHPRVYRARALRLLPGLAVSADSSAMET